MQSNGAAGDSAGAGRGEETTTQQVLRNWLESTLTEHKNGLTDREFQVLREVVATLPSDAAALGQCAEQLVDAFLQLRFPAVSGREEMRHRMSARIAQTLCSDPTARTRLLEFQQLLRQSTT